MICVVRITAIARDNPATYLWNFRDQLMNLPQALLSQ